MNKRHQDILDTLKEHGARSYQEFSEQLGVTTMTIRRDADYLAGEGLIIKTLGGVQKAGAPVDYDESPMRSRITTRRREKRAIAECALQLVDSGQTLFLDGSTTCLQLATLLHQHRQGLTIVTNSALISLELAKSGGNLAVGIGGLFDRDTASYIGPIAEENAKGFFVDLAFMSTKGFVPAEGTFESSVGNLRIKQLIAAQCAELVLLVDHSKFGERALCKAIDTSQIQGVVTDDTTPESELDYLRQHDKDVRVATFSGHTNNHCLR